jgi:hypothetical protein
VSSIPQTPDRKPRCAVPGRRSGNPCPNESADFDGETRLCVKHLALAIIQVKRRAVEARKALGEQRPA